MPSPSRCDGLVQILWFKILGTCKIFEAEKSCSFPAQHRHPFFLVAEHCKILQWGLLYFSGLYAECKSLCSALSPSLTLNNTKNPSYKLTSSRHFSQLKCIWYSFHFSAIMFASIMIFFIYFLPLKFVISISRHRYKEDLPCRKGEEKNRHGQL